MSKKLILPVLLFVAACAVAWSLLGCTADQLDRAANASERFSTAATQPAIVSLPTTRGEPSPTISFDLGPFGKGAAVGGLSVALILRALAAMKRATETEAKK